MAHVPTGRSAPAAESVPDADTAADPGLCPRCGGKLTNPDGLGWCAGCGYCRSLEEEGQAIAPAPEPAAPTKPSALGASEFGEAMRRMPGWAWPLLGGVVVVAGASVAVDSLLPEECLARALCSAIQMVLSVVGLIAAQLWAVLLVGADEDGLGAKDVILPGRLWRAAFQRLPATRKPVWLGAWCLTALVCGVAVVGGFNYWLEATQARRLRRIAEGLDEGTPRATQRESPGDLKGSLRPLDLPPALVPPAEDKRPLVQCVVIGYQTDGKTVTGLILATTDGDRLKFAGIVREGLSPDLRQSLLERLSSLERKDPLIPGVKVNGARWVKPGVFCDVFRTAGKPGEGEEPAFKGLRD